MRRIFEGKRVKDGIRGEATVISIMAPTNQARYHQFTGKLLVETPHRAPYVVDRSLYIRELKWPTPGMKVPVMVDRGDESKVQVIWDQVPDRDREQMQREVSEGLNEGRLVPRSASVAVPGELPPNQVAELHELFDHSGETRGAYMLELAERPRVPTSG